MAIVRRSQFNSPKDIKPLYYSDVSSVLQAHPNTRDISTIENEDSVKSAIRNILLTRKGERFFNPFFGSDIYSLLFENFSPSIETDLKAIINNALNNFEPRANVLKLHVSPYPDENGFVITLIFSVINRSEPVVMNILLDRIR